MVRISGDIKIYSMSSFAPRFLNSSSFTCTTSLQHPRCSECTPIPQLPYKAQRISETFYTRGQEVVWWNGYRIQCSHKRISVRCKDCITDDPSRKGANICQFDKCCTRSQYGIDGSKATRCSVHKEIGMIEVARPRCIHEGCTTSRTYNYKGQKPQYCSVHKNEGMVNVVTSRCIHDGCDIVPIFGREGEKAQYCKSHKKAEMVDVVNYHCIYDGCNIRCTFGHEGELPTHCDEHKEERMVLSREYRLCSYEDCGIRSTYGYEGGIPLYCSNHKKDEMVSVTTRQCASKDCARTASLGHKGGRPEYCAKHRELGMIYIYNYYCIHKSCTSLASYGLPGQRPNHCSRHKIATDIKNPHARCQHPSCASLALYGLSSPTHCEAHHLPEEFDLVQRSCISCNLPDVLDSNGHCSTCDPSAFERIRLAKQRETKVYFDAHGIAYTSYDKILDGGFCGLERPDFVHPAPHGLITEVDEHQHSGYPCECEITRMINVTGAMGLPTLFLRYNPDTYKPISGEQWSIKQRLEALAKVIRYWQEHPLPLDGQTFVIYMFYSGENYDKWSEPQLVL